MQDIVGRFNEAIEQNTITTTAGLADARPTGDQVVDPLGWGGAEGEINSYIWHSTDVRVEWPPFSTLPRIWLATFFQQKVYEWIPMWKAPLFWHPGICT